MIDRVPSPHRPPLLSDAVDAPDTPDATVADLEGDACYLAMKTHDARFDGSFFTAVTSTGIYCRPSCPATTPRPANVRFYPTAAAAHEAGLRACKRCLQRCA